MCGSSVANTRARREREKERASEQAEEIAQPGRLGRLERERSRGTGRGGDLLCLESGWTQHVGGGIGGGGYWLRRYSPSFTALGT